MTRATLLLAALWAASCSSCAHERPTRPASTAAPAAEDVPEPSPATPAPAEPEIVRLAAGEALLDAEGLRGAFVVRRAGETRFLAARPELADERLLPASTFKIPSALVALETGVAPDAAFVLPWDGERHEMEAWNRDHDLASAMRDSVVWYFQELARRIGRDRMAEWVARLGYGNGEIGDRVDRFWLEGPLAISPREQVEFVEGLAGSRLPLSERTMEAVRAILPSREVESGTIRAKTGTHVDDEGCHAWLVGWLERDGEPQACFALVLLGGPGDARRLTRARWDLAARLLDISGAIVS